MITSFIGACVSRVVWISTVFRIYRTIESVYLIMPISWFLTTLSLYLFVLREIKKLPDGGE
ncbi:MAG: hypothetical protein II802_00540 [Clostridia bacterium]|nr:hypothetical protein [Clostridia bacterium]